jgi:hypothetical protein
MRPIGVKEPPTPMEKRKLDNKRQAAEKKRKGTIGEDVSISRRRLSDEEKAERRLAINSIPYDEECPFVAAVWEDTDFRNMLTRMYQHSDPDPRTGAFSECEEGWFTIMITVIPRLLRKMVDNMQVFFQTLPLALIAQHNQGVQGHGGRGGYSTMPQYQPRAPQYQPRAPHSMGGGNIFAIEPPAGGRGGGPPMAGQFGGRETQPRGMPPGYVPFGRGAGGGNPGRGRGGRGDAGRQPYAGRAATP